MKMSLESKKISLYIVSFFLKTLTRSYVERRAEAGGEKGLRSEPKNVEKK